MKISIIVFAALIAFQASANTCGSSYTVQSGDICYNIAQDNGLSLNAFLALNSGINCDDLSIGQVVCLSAGSNPAPAPAPASTSTSTSTSSSGCSSSYTVQSGDICYNIAQDNGLSLNAFLALNSGINCDDLSVGQVVCLSEGSNPAPASTSTSSSEDSSDSSPQTSQPSGPTASTASNVQLPAKAMGMYVLLADDTVPGYTSTDVWTPALNEYQVTGANVLFFTFINPGTMQVPPAFATFAQSRGTGASGAIPSGTTIMFAVGGYSYSITPNPWSWLTSPEAATAMAQEVATWPSKYGCDGIDLDIETGAGDAANVGPNLVTFIQVLKQTNPSMIVTQPVFGYPQVAAETYVVNQSWNANGQSLGLADTVGIMLYQGTESLQYVKNYAQGTQQWQGFPITVDVTTSDIVVGAGGQADSSDILALADAVNSQNLRGIMVWYASVIDTKTGQPAFQYSAYDDASVQSTTSVWAQALAAMQ